MEGHGGMAALGMAVLLGAGACGPAPKSAALALNPAGCPALVASTVVGYALRDDAPRLDRRWRYRCVAFRGQPGDRAQVTVFAQGFAPELYLLDPETPTPLVAWSRRGPAAETAQVGARLNRAGIYLAVVTTVGENESGSFLLDIQFDTPE